MIKNCHHLSNTRFNLPTTCRQDYWLWIQVLQARPTDRQWETNSFLPGINIPHSHYHRPNSESCVILSHLRLILFIYRCEIGKITQSFQKCCDVCVGKFHQRKVLGITLKPLKRKRILEKSVSCLSICFQDTVLTSSSCSSYPPFNHIAEEQGERKSSHSSICSLLIIKPVSPEHLWDTAKWNICLSASASLEDSAILAEGLWSFLKFNY